jgi:hypothetical protein
MYSYLFSFFNTGTIIILLNDYFKRIYPDIYEQVVVEASFKIIYIYSSWQILNNKLYCIFNKFINSYPLLKNVFDRIYKKRNQLHQIKHDGEIITKEYLEEGEDVHFENAFYIFSDNEKEIQNNIILQSYPSSLEYEESNVKFILFQIKINETFIKIDLKTDKYNFYIVNNIIDKKFLMYYLRCYSNVDLNYNIDNYKYFNIKIIDQNADMREIKITDDKFIKIRKNDYIY